MNKLNFAQSTNFIVGIPALNNIHMYLTNAIVPGISLNHPEVYNQGLKGFVSADTPQYNNTMSFNAILDEDFKVYETLINEVFKHTTNAVDGGFKLRDFDIYNEIHNNKGNLIFTIWYKNCKIESVSDISLDANNDTVINTIDFSIKYDWFEIKHEGLSDKFRKDWNVYPKDVKTVENPNISQDTKVPPDPYNTYTNIP